MSALMFHELRIAGRRFVWPAALVLHASAASLFVAIWGPTGGIPLWQASALRQLAAADSVVVAVVLTWLSTIVLADDDQGRRLVDWSALLGRPARTIFNARVCALLVLTIAFAAVGAPAFVAAAEVSASSRSELALQLLGMGAFALLCAGVSAGAVCAVRHRLGAWCVAILCCLVAVAGVRALDGAMLRVAVPAIFGTALLAFAPSIIQPWRLDAGN